MPFGKLQLFAAIFLTLFALAHAPLPGRAARVRTEQARYWFMVRGQGADLSVALGFAQPKPMLGAGTASR